MTTNTERRELETFILDGSARTLREICTEWFGTQASARDEGQVDKALQRLRKRGAIKMTRDGRRILWKATPSQATQEA